jgi:hypothetical protein
MSIRLQERDEYLLRLLLYDFLLLTREQIQQLIPRGLRRTNQRLSLLLKNKLLARRDPVDRLSPNTIFYYLGEKAGNALDLDDNSAVRERRTRARNFGDSYLRHLHLINAVHIKFVTHKGTGYRFLRWMPYDNTNWDEKSTGLKLRPDGFVTFAQDGQRFCCFVEVDRGTERGGSIRKKIEQYVAFDSADGLWKEFGEDWFRVLFVCTEESRASALLKIFRTGILWVTTADKMLSRSLFDPYWESNARKELSLHLGPSPAQVERSGKRKAAVVAPTPKTVAPIERARPEPRPQPPIVIPRKPRKKFNWKLCLDVAYGVSAAGLIIWLAPQAYRDVLAYVQSWSGLNLNPTWKLVATAAASLFAAWLLRAL